MTDRDRDRTRYGSRALDVIAAAETLLRTLADERHDIEALRREVREDRKECEELRDEYSRLDERQIRLEERFAQRGQDHEKLLRIVCDGTDGTPALVIQIREHADELRRMDAWSVRRWGVALLLLNILLTAAFHYLMKQ